MRVVVLVLMRVRMGRRDLSPGVSVCDAVLVRVGVLVRMGVLVLMRMRMWRRDFSPGGRVLPGSLGQVELGCRHARAQHPLRGQFVLADAEAPERAAKVLERESGVEQGAQNHVARGAIETVEIQQLHAKVSGHRR